MECMSMALRSELFRREKEMQTGRPPSPSPYSYPYPIVVGACPCVLVGCTLSAQVLVEVFKSRAGEGSVSGC